MVHGSLRLTLLVALGATSACIELRGYPCESDDQCVLDGSVGRCEDVGFCSYPDGSCSSGYRFEARAGQGLAGQCLELSGTGTDTGGSDSSSSDAEDSSETGSSETGSSECPGESCGCAQWVVSGTWHSCALGSDDQLYCWGGNMFGQLGRGTNADAYDNPAVVDLPEGSTIRQIDAKDHVCALLDGGEVFCWGHNQQRQSDWTEPADSVLSPRRVAGLEELMPERIAVGYGISCAAAGAELVCWGDDDGMAQPSSLVGPLPGSITHLTMGESHGCVAFEDGTIVCIGQDDLGQLGDDAQVTPGDVAQVALPPHDGIIDLVAGRNHTCAILEIAGQDIVVCWGANGSNEAGGFSEIDQVLPTPQAVAALDPGDYVELSLSETHSCVRSADARLLCWGSNDFGMSDPWADGWAFGAHEVQSPEETIAVRSTSAGYVHTCSALTDGRVLCWGCNALFQLGPEHDANTCDLEQSLVGEVQLPCAP